MLSLKPVSGYQRGTIFSLLYSSYRSLCSPNLEKNLRDFDQEVFDNPDTVGSCTFITCLEDEVVGLVSYDPRQGPEMGVIGHNCIIPSHRGKGYGKQQIMEVLRILKEKGFRRIKVSTGKDDFFTSAQKMYLSCGFIEVDRRDDEIEYEIEL